MAAENPEFTQAVSRYYSTADGKLADAAIGETAWRAMAEELLARDPLPAGLTYGPLLARRAAGTAAEQGARRKRDHRYLDRQAKALKALAEVEERQAAALKAGAEPEQRAWAPVEFVWEAYLFLRKRDGEGSPLPTKADVKQYAALIWAFADLGLLGRKLPEYLWQNRGLTEAETRKVLRQQARRLRPETNDDWTRYLKAAGLSGLPRRRAGGRPRGKQIPKK
jgi:hypothetical protein